MDLQPHNGFDSKTGIGFCRTTSERQSDGTTVVTPQCHGCRYAKDGAGPVRLPGIMEKVRATWKACPDRRTA